MMWTLVLIFGLCAPLVHADGLQIVTVNDLVQKSAPGARPSYEMGKTDRFRIDFLNEKTLAFVSPEKSDEEPSYVLKLRNLGEAAFVRRAILNPKNDVTIDSRTLRSSDGRLKSSNLRTQLIVIRESKGPQLSLSRILAERAERKVALQGQYASRLSAQAASIAETIH